MSKFDEIPQGKEFEDKKEERKLFANKKANMVLIGTGVVFLVAVIGCGIFLMV